LNMKVLDIVKFKERVKNGDDIGNEVYVRKFFDTEIKSVDDNENVLQFAISTGSVDRDEDTINPDGWDLANYRKNPVVLWAHNYDELPVARSLGEWVDDGKLKSNAEFTSRELYPFGFMVREMLKGGFLNTTSVGFKPKEWMVADDESRDFGFDFFKQELLEYSVVPVPSNPEALIEARSKGIDIDPIKEWAEKVLDGVYGESGLWIPVKRLEKVSKIVDGNKKNFVVGVSFDGNEKDVSEGVNDLDDTEVLGEDVDGQEKQVDGQRFELEDWVEPIVPHMDGHDMPMQIIGVNVGVFYEVLMPGETVPHRWYADFELNPSEPPEGIEELGVQEMGIEDDDPLNDKAESGEDWILELDEEKGEEEVEVEMLKGMIRDAVKDAVGDLKSKLTGRVD